MSILELEKQVQVWDISEICPVKVVESEVLVPILPVSADQVAEDLKATLMRNRRFCNYRTC